MTKAAQQMRLENLMLQLWDFHYQGMTSELTDTPEKREKLKSFLHTHWEVLDREPLEDAIRFTITVTMEEHSIQMAYQMVDFFRDDLGLKYDD